MAVLRARSEIVGPTEIVQLKAVFRDNTGNPVDLDTFPTVSIVQPSGNVVITPTSAGVYRLGIGVYGFDYTIGIYPEVGVWSDIWQGNLDTSVIVGTFNFVVYTTQLPALNSDGYVHLGDDPGFHYSQTAIFNINKLLKGLKARLKSAGKAKSKDQYGNDIYIDCDIYSIDTLVTFLATTLSNFNEIPHFTMFTFDDTQFVDQFYEVLVQGAVLIALSSQALIERGREFQISDNGVQFTPPTVSELLNTQWSTELTNYTEKVKFIKNSLKSSPISLGSLTASPGRNPAFARASRLRFRSLF